MRTTDLLLALPSGHPHSHTRPQTGSPRRSPCSWTTGPGGSASGWGSAGLSPTNSRQSVQYISICYKCKIGEHICLGTKFFKRKEKQQAICVC